MHLQCPALENARVASFLGVALTNLGQLLPAFLFLAAVPPSASSPALVAGGSRDALKTAAMRAHLVPQVFSLTSLLSCIVSNAATVVLLYSVLRDVQVDGLRASQCMCAMMLGASSAFMTPIGYQTNLMVLAPGGYRFGDFALLGGCLTLLVSGFVAVGTWLLPEWYMP